MRKGTVGQSRFDRLLGGAAVTWARFYGYVMTGVTVNGRAGIVYLRRGPHRRLLHAGLSLLLRVGSVAGTAFAAVRSTGSLDIKNNHNLVRFGTSFGRIERIHGPLKVHRHNALTNFERAFEWLNRTDNNIEIKYEHVCHPSTSHWAHVALITSPP